MDLRNPDNRALIIKEFKTPDNVDRKDKSFEATEIYNGRLRQFVIQYLEKLFSSSTVKEMPIQSGANLSKRIVQERASIYKSPALRNFQNVSEEQEAVLNTIYSDMKADFMLSKANEFYCLQNQCLLQCIPVDGKFKLRVLKMHHFDCIPMPDNPEEALAIIISSYDKRNRVNTRDSNYPVSGGEYSRPMASDISDKVDQTIADEDDGTQVETYEVWTREYIDEKGELVPSLNFIMDKKGNVLSDDPLSPISFLPFVDISAYKDFQYFCSDHNSITEFTKEFNALMTEVAQGHRLQSFSQPILSGNKDLLPRNLETGPNTVLFLPTDPDLGDVTFSYASPNGNIAHGIDLAEQLLAQFLSCQGIDPKVVSTESGSRYSSGIERLLSMIERFDATRVDFSLFQEVENKLYHIIHYWHNALQGTDVLDDKYQMPQLSDDSDISVSFAKPEGAQTMLDKIAFHEKLIGQGLGSRVTAVMDLYGMARDEAQDYIRKVDEDERGDFAELQIPQDLTEPEEE